VFEAAALDLTSKYNSDIFSLQTFPVDMTTAHTERMDALMNLPNALIVACERSGPSQDGASYTMRGIDMKALTAPIHKLVTNRRHDVTFIAVGDGGNELGMGKVIDQVRLHIPDGDKVGCVIAADYLVAASVSNWGGYALAAGAALVRANVLAEENESCSDEQFQALVKGWMDKCLPTGADEVELLDRCVDKGCRDGVSGKVEATVDGMSLETSLQCLRDIRSAALKLGDAQ
jgi:hypothetical protein